MSGACARFKQNAWKKDFCSNCYRPKEEHQASPRPPPPSLPLLQPSQGILLGVSTAKKKKVKKKSVSFTKKESEVIGFGGGGESGSEDDDEDYDWGREHHSEDEREPAGEEEKALERLTKSNTDFNSTLSNLSAPASSPPVLQLGKQQKQTLQVTIQPFSMENRKSNLTKYLEEMPLITTKTSEPPKEVTPKKEEEVRVVSQVEKDKPSQVMPIMKTIVIENKMKEETRSNPEGRKTQITRGNVITKNNGEQVKNKLYINSVINSKCDNKKSITQLKDDENKKTDPDINKIIINTGSNVEEKNSRNLNESLPEKKDCSEVTVKVLKIVGDGLAESREMAGEPDGKADSDEPETPLTPPPRASFLHRDSNSIISKDKITSREVQQKDSPPRDLLLKEKENQRETSVQEKDNVREVSILHQDTLRELPVQQIDNLNEPPAQQRINLREPPVVLRDNHRDLPSQQRNSLREPVVLERSSLGELPVLLRDNQRDLPNQQRSSLRDSVLVERDSIREQLSVQLRDKINKDLPSLPRDTTALQLQMTVEGRLMGPSSSPAPSCSPPPVPASPPPSCTPPSTPSPPPSPPHTSGTPLSRSTPPASPPARSKRPAPKPPAAPDPVPRRRGSLTTDSGGTEKKKTRVRATLRKFLRFGSTGREDEPRSPEEEGPPRPRPQIIHPLDLNKSAVQVLPPTSFDKNVSEIYASTTSIASYAVAGRPSKPPPPPRSESLNLMERLRPSPNSESNVYANLGEGRCGITPVKPQRTGSLRDQSQQQMREQGAKVAEHHQQPSPTASQADSDNVYECVGGVSSAPECDMSLPPYYGSETESDIYYPYVSFQNGECKTKFKRKERGIVHSTLEENYGAVIIANHEALSHLLKQIKNKKPEAPKEIQNVELTLNNFNIDEEDVLRVGGFSFVNSKFNDLPLTLALGPATLSIPDVMEPLSTFKSSLPIKYVDNDTIAGTVTILRRKKVERLSVYARKLEKSVESVREGVHILLQVVKHMLASKGKVNIDNFIVFSSESSPCAAYLPTEGSETVTIEDCLREMVRRLIGPLPLGRVLESCRTVGDAEGVLEVWLWGPASPLALPSLSRWLDLERATFLSGLVATPARSVDPEQLAFLVNATPKSIAHSSQLIDLHASS